MSTFTSYIQRLRGYIDAPDKNIYYHNYKYTGYSYEDENLAREPQNKDNYIREFPYLWSREIDEDEF